MADKSGGAMVLTAMTGMDGILEANKPIALKKTHVVVEFSEPFYPGQMDGKERKDFYAGIPATIQAMLDTVNTDELGGKK